MAQPVWVLSVDLQTKTATFQTGLAEAARSARSAFGGISSSASEMGEGVRKGSIDVRHSLGLVDNVIRGAHAQAMADMVRMYAQSAIVMSTLPIAATAAGLALIGGIAYEAAEHVHKLKEAAEKLSNDITEQNTAGNNVFSKLNDDILRAEQRADELRNDHLAALKIQLQLINNQSLSQLVSSFGAVQKAADAVFKDLKSGWYEFGSGSEGASHALEQFHVQYANLISQGNEKGASDLLHGTLEKAQHVLAVQKQVAALGQAGTAPLNLSERHEWEQLKKEGVGTTQKEIDSQEALVTALEAQAGIETRINALKKQDGDNSKTEYGNQAAARRSAGMKEAAQAQLTMGAAALAGEKAQADAELTIHRASIEQRLASDLDFAQRKYQMDEAANAQEIGALNKSGADYLNQLKALNDKKLEIQQTYDTEIAGLKARASVSVNERDVTAMEQGIRQQIDATDQGSAARLAVINAAIREEQAHQLENTSFYRNLMTQRVQVMREMATEEATLRQSAAGESARHESAMGMGRVQQQKQSNALYNSGHHTSRSQIIAQETELENQVYAIKMAALQKQSAGLDKGGKDYLNKLRTIQDREAELTQAHENQLTAIKARATEQSNAVIASGYERMTQSISHSLTETLMRHQTYAQMMTSIGNEVISGMMEQAIKSALLDDFDKEKDAAKAARKMFLAGSQFPFPANIVAAPVLAAGAFAAVMAFNRGTDGVPGVGRADVVPAMLTPGEGVVPGGVMDGLRNVARNGGFQQQPSVHIHVRPTYHVQTIDGDGFGRALSKHSQELEHHVKDAMRRANH